MDSLNAINEALITELEAKDRLSQSYILELKKEIKNLKITKSSLTERKDYLESLLSGNSESCSCGDEQFSELQQECDSLQKELRESYRDSRHCEVL